MNTGANRDDVELVGFREHDMVQESRMLVC